MTTLLEQLHSDRMAAFKAKDQVTKDALTTLYAECVAVGKNDGNRDTTDAEVIAVIKKTINNNNISIDAIMRQVETSAQFIKVQHLEWENDLFARYLPKQMTNEEISKNIDKFIEERHKVEGWLKETLPGDTPAQKKPAELKLKDIMGYFKISFDGRYDGKTLAAIAKEKL